MTSNGPTTTTTPELCPDCEGRRQVLTAQVVGRGLRRRTIEGYALCLTCGGTGHAPNGEVPA
ncbi:hypothetical protein Skr01_57270 [Sphaerisporangium krabiense]|uniref:DnaJ-class molecular chaperone n=1 Tax=Sphaerisporangium krabiense TaxID=763782 RepID=A0A7W8Z8P3_9ACTN|nr:hypothetical protein [Sphaerisporangium krabiense]MBB5629506.1 DnaJ-class molecular chaperone [Sphaerisporangium krabiense]GII65642.1 hypothetical protein Skr01_57270 [Sphaerisporangium krabiense]